MCYNKVGLDAEDLYNLYAKILRKVHLSKAMSEESSLPIINISSLDTYLIHQDPGTNSGEVQNIITTIHETEHDEPNDITFIDKESVDVEKS